MPTCELCGFVYGKDPNMRSHLKAHDKFVNGPETALRDGIHLILPKSPLRDRRAAENAAKIFRQEMHYDKVCYYADAPGDFRKCKTSASIYVMNSRVVGLLAGRSLLRSVKLTKFWVFISP